MDFSLRSKWQSSCFFKKPHPKIFVKNKNPARQKNYTLLYIQIFSKTNSQLKKPTQKNPPIKFLIKKTAYKNSLIKNFSPHCNKSYSFSFTFLLNFAKFYSSSGENSLKFRKFLSNFCKSAKFSHAQSPILPPLEKNLPKICKKFQTLSFV